MVDSFSASVSIEDKMPALYLIYLLQPTYL